MKKIIAIVLAFSMILTGALTLIFKSGSYVYAENEESPDSIENTQTEDLGLLSKSAILMEANSGTVLYEKNPDEKLKPASVTKIMTLLLIFTEISEGRLSMDDIVTISEHAASMGGSQCFFEQGEQQKVSDMIKCIEVSSGNDAAVAMGEHIAGSETAFVQLMNDKATELGMVNTNFVNACGLDADGHLTTARDIAIMTRELVTKHPEIFDYSTIWMDSIIHKTARGESQFDLANTNKFLNQYTGANGLKTGFTSEAGYCMSATANRNNILLISVIMKADTKEIRNSEAGKLLDYGFSKCKIYTDEEVMKDMPEICVKGGVKSKVPVRNIDNYKLVLIGTNPESIKKTYEINDTIKAPVVSGDVLGKVVYRSNDIILGEKEILADGNVSEKDFLYGIKHVKKLFLIGGN